MRITTRLFLGLVACITMGCSGTEQTQSEKPTTPSTPIRPTSYPSATVAAMSTSLGLPVGPWDCQYVVVTGTPGSVLVERRATGDETYTANAHGSYVSARGLSLSLLVPPDTTLWFIAPETGMEGMEVAWDGVDFIGDAGLGATYTAPAADMISSEMAHQITVSFIPIPHGDG